MDDFKINDKGQLYLGNFSKNVKKCFFVFSPIAFFSVATMCLMNYISYSGRKKGYIAGAIFGIVIFVWLYVIRGFNNLSALKRIINEISIETDFVSITCSKGLTNKEYNFRVPKSQLSIIEANSTKMFQDLEVMIFNIEDNLKLYFISSFWDNQDEIIQLIKSKDVR